MGKLAERLADAKRSGVYRVEVIDALEEAVALNAYALARIALDDASESSLCGLCARSLASRADGDWGEFAASLAEPGWSPAPGHVLLFAGFETLVRRSPQALNPLVTALDAAAATRRAAGLPLFAAFLDPARLLTLGPLYNWHRRSPQAPALKQENLEPQGG